MNNTHDETCPYDHGDDAEQLAADEQFMKELHEFVATLPTPSPESVASYDSKMQFLESVYNDIRTKNPSFRPIAVYEEPIENPRGKYTEIVYSIASTDRSYHNNNI